MKKLNLFLAILLALVTTCIILLYFCTHVESMIGWEIVTLFSIIGYLGAYGYYDNYKKIKK
jgi:hypothetical protein